MQMIRSPQHVLVYDDDPWSTWVTCTACEAVWRHWVDLDSDHEPCNAAWRTLTGPMDWSNIPELTYS